MNELKKLDIKVKVERDFDGVFEERIRKAIELNEKNGVETVPSIIINSGPYRSYCMKFKRENDVCYLDFYSASRTFGFEHTIQNIADAIAK